MANFPTSLDSYTTKVDNVDSVMADHINGVQSAVEAIEAKVGVNSSAVTSTLDYKIRNIPSQDGTTLISNLNADKFDGADLDTDGTLSGNSDTSVPSEKAVKTYSDTKVPLTRTVNGKALSSNITLGLDSADFSMSDNTTNNATTSAHGFLKKLSNVATEFMNGVGNWVVVTIDALLPSQTGNSGKFLTTNGSVASWGAVTTVSQENDTDSGTSFDGNETTFLSDSKTITSGKTVLLISSGYVTSTVTAQQVTIRLKYGSTTAQEIVVVTQSVPSKMSYSTCAIVTGLSGATTFTVTAQYNSATSQTAYGNLVIIEF